MIIVMKAESTRENAQAVCDRLSQLGYQVQPVYGSEKTILSAVGAPEYEKFEAVDQLRSFEGVDEIVFLAKPYNLVAREYRGEPTVVDVRGVPVGGREVVVMAGPCTVESEEQLMRTAEAVSCAGASILRGGAFKPSTSPYSYQGMGLRALELLKEAGRRFDLRIVTEVMDVRKVELVSEFADILQIGTRNMQNYDLLKEVGRSRKPVLLKRGMNARLEEWLLAAEYVAAGGNPNIILCERGIRTFETYTRNTLDLSAAPAVKELSHLPVIVDPSQGTGIRTLVPPMALAAIAAGADGLLIEVHPNPDEAIKDGPQSITIETFQELMPRIQAVAAAVGRAETFSLAPCLELPRS